MKTEVAKQMKKKHKWFKYNTWDSLQLLLLQLPAIIYVLIFCYIPMYGIIIAFKKFNPSKGIWGSEWIGFKNFEFFFSSQDLWRVTRNTVLYSLWFLFIGTVFAIL